MIKQELELVLKARYPLLYLVAPEEEPVEGLLSEIAIAQKRQIYFWDFARGWTDKQGADKGNPMTALARIEKAPGQIPALFVMKDFATVIAPGSNGQINTGQLPVVREIKNLAREMVRDRRTLVILSEDLKLPRELREETTVIDLALPDVNEIQEIIQAAVGKKLKLTDAEFEQLTKACQGLTRQRIQRVLAKSLVKSGRIDNSAFEAVLAEKRQTIRETGILEFVPVKSDLESVGGLENLKAWVQVRSEAFSDRARAYGLPAPKGLLLAGIQGTGKSLSAKTIAAEWKLPLLRLDVGRLFGGIVGESESRIRQVIRLAEAISPCILFIDEADKAFANISSGVDGDSGTSRRVFGTLLTWMQEKTAEVFVLMTANRTELLPAELIRKGRLDDLFWVDLPNESERSQIFRVHLKRLRPNRLHEFDFDLLANRSKDLNGAEIEQVIFEAMQNAFSRSEEFTQGDVLDAIATTVPLARIAQDQIEALKAWAVRSGAKSASVVTIHTLKPESGLLEVDSN